MEEVFAPLPEDDLYPSDEEGQKKILDWANRVYKMCWEDKQLLQKRWDKYYLAYRSYVKERSPGDWKSRVWIPIAFFVIETVAPRLVSQLPGFTVRATREEFVPASENLEDLIHWASEQSDLYLELVKAIKSSLIYGTGILKTSFVEQKAYEMIREPVMEERYQEMPMIDPSTGQPMMDVNGAPMTQQASLGAMPTGEEHVRRQEYVAYAGPKAEAVDIENFFVDPVADSIENARFVVHRSWRDRQHLEKMFEAGVYKKPPEDTWRGFLEQHAQLRRRQMAGQSASGTNMGTDLDKSLIEVFEFWTDTYMCTVAGATDGQGALMHGCLLRVEANPYGHGEKPFIRVVDHIVPHEFWGIGELEPLEGLQDLINKLWNARVDNVALVLNSMFLAVMDYVVDPNDLKVRPGGVVRIQDGVPLNQAVQTLNLGEVTNSSYNEVAEAERMTEKVSNVSELTAGTGADPALGRTATGLTLVSETGNVRFAHKTKIAELTGFKRLARQFGVLLQQYAPPETTIRRLGPLGQQQFQTITSASIMGRFEYEIETESSTQTESMRKEQAMSLFQLLAFDPYTRPLKVRENLLKRQGIKDVTSYLLTEEELQQMYAMQQQQAAAGQGGEETATTQ